MDRFLNLLNSELIDDFVIWLDTGARTCFISSPAEKFLGIEYDASRGVLLEELIHPDDIQFLLERICSSKDSIVSGNPVTLRLLNGHREFKCIEFKLNNAAGLESNPDRYELRASSVDGLTGSTAFELVFPTIEKNPYPIYWIDGGNRIIYVNDSVCRQLGYLRDELLGMSIAEVDANATDDELSRLWRGLRKYNEIHFESLHRCKDGSHVMVEISAFYKEIGGRDYFYAFTKDITGESRNEYKLIMNEITYRTHYKFFPVPSYTWKFNGRDFVLIDFNDAAEDETSGTITKCLGMTAAEFFDNDHDTLENFGHCLNSKSTIHIIGKFPGRPIDNYRYFDLTLIFMPPDLITVHAEDITDKLYAEERIQSLAKFPDENPNPVFKVNGSYSLTYNNGASETVLKEWYEGDVFCLPEDLKKVVDEVIANNSTRNREFNFNSRTFFVTASPVEDSGEVYIYASEITEKIHAREELLLAGHVFEATAEGIMVCDHNALIVRVNPAFEKITGYAFDMVRGKNPSVLKSGRHSDSFYSDMWGKLNAVGKWEGEIWNRRRSGEVYPSWMTIDAVNGKEGELKNYVCVFSDISDIKKSEEEIVYQAYHDPLTGLPNRNLFNDRLTLALIQAKRENTRAAVLFIDLDRFKIINDGLGHIVGDYLLQEASSRLEKCIRTGDTLARIGGDEFILILPFINEISDSTKVANRILGYFREPMFIEGHELFVTSSIGISIFPDDGQNASEMYKNSDIAMYHAKSMGGNGYKFFSREMNNDTNLRLKLEIDLRRALDLDQFELYYQPIVNFQQQKIVGAEALIRWNHPELGLVTPDSFIPIAEETGLITAINDWVMKRACSDHRNIKQEGYGNFYFSVNMTSHQFMNRRIVDTVFSALKEYGMSPDNLVIEITEDSIMKNVDEIIGVMAELRALGIRFSIDDFGTGYSSLSYLKKFPLDNLKIDRSFVVDLPYDYDSNTLARTIIVLARELGLNVIAEGVEEQEQLDFFKNEYNCLIQGYYYSKPVSLNGLILFLKKCELL